MYFHAWIAAAVSVFTTFLIDRAVYAEAKEQQEAAQKAIKNNTGRVEVHITETNIATGDQVVRTVHDEWSDWLKYF